MKEEYTGEYFVSYEEGLKEEVVQKLYQEGFWVKESRLLGGLFIGREDAQEIGALEEVLQEIRGVKEIEKVRRISIPEKPEEVE